MLEKIQTLKGQYAELRNQESELHKKIETVAMKIEEYQVAEDEHQKELDEHKVGWHMALSLTRFIFWYMPCTFQATIRSIEEMKATAKQDVEKFDHKISRVQQRLAILQRELKHLENTLAVSTWNHGVFFSQII